MTKSEFEKAVQKQMKILEISRKEAEELVREDEKIDKMSMSELKSDLTKDQQQVIKQMTKTGTKKSTSIYKFDTKPKRKDAQKEDFIQKLAELLPTLAENVEIVNSNREISFNLGENSFSLTLTKHRNKK